MPFKNRKLEIESKFAEDSFMATKTKILNKVPKKRKFEEIKKPRAKPQEVFDSKAAASQQEQTSEKHMNLRDSERTLK